MLSRSQHKFYCQIIFLCNIGQQISINHVDETEEACESSLSGPRPKNPWSEATPWSADNRTRFIAGRVVCNENCQKPN